MAHYINFGLFPLALALGAASAANSTRRPAQVAVPGHAAEANAVMVIQAYRDGLNGIHAVNPGVHLSVGRDSTGPDEPVLFVEYPVPTADPAGRDVRCDAESQNWTTGRAISFQIKPDHAVRLSLSFMDRNGVAYTTWTELKGGVWQSVHIPLTEIRPNPYFQPPGANTGAPLDVSEVKFIAFAPQDPASGRLTIGRFVVSK